MFRKSFAVVALLFTTNVFAHDTWVETNTNIIRCDDAVYLDLCLGNHGNDHRDFKYAGKLDLDGCTLAVEGPDGTSYDLLDRLMDTGYAPKEGFWRCKFTTSKPGIYLASHRTDKIVNHGRPVRSLKSAKTFFIVSPSLDHVDLDHKGFEKSLGHALEFVAQSNPVIPMGPGQRISVQLLFKGKPLSGARVAFIPRGEVLKADFDDRFERNTDAEGLASFTPNTGNQYLVVAHHETDEAGDQYTGTKYSATMTVFVPESCPCCDK